MEVWTQESMWPAALIIAMVIKYQTPKSAQCRSEKGFFHLPVFSGATCSIGNLVTPLGI